LMETNTVFDANGDVIMDDDDDDDDFFLWCRSMICLYRCKKRF
jgi:hypothetical protein